MDKGWAYHNLEHVQNVAKLVGALLGKLEYDKNLIEEAKIAAILHDIGAIEGKNEHALRSYNFAKKMDLNAKVLFNNEEWQLFSSIARSS